MEFLDSNNNNLTKTAKEFNVTRKMIRYWVKKRKTIEGSDSTHKRVKRRIMKKAKVVTIDRRSSFSNGYARLGHKINQSITGILRKKQPN